MMNIILDLVPERLRGEIASLILKIKQAKLLLNKVVVFLHVIFVKWKKLGIKELVVPARLFDWESIS